MPKIKLIKNIIIHVQLTIHTIADDKKIIDHTGLWGTK